MLVFYSQQIPDRTARNRGKGLCGCRYGRERNNKKGNITIGPSSQSGAILWGPWIYGRRASDSGGPGERLKDEDLKPAVKVY